MQIQGKTVLVTGGSRGLGRATAIALAAEGAAGVALLARDEGALTAVAREVELCGARAVAIRTDVRDNEAVIGAFEQARQTFGSLDLVINNAGVGPHKPFHELSSDEADGILDVNVRGVMNVMRAAVADMNGRGGIIVNVASALGKIPLGGYSVYTASKSAVVALSRVARKELRNTGVKLLCFCPGMIDTAFQDDRRDELKQIPGWILRPPERVAADLLLIIRQERAESFGQAYLAILHFFYRLLAG